MRACACEHEIGGEQANSCTRPPSLDSGAALGLLGAAPQAQPRVLPRAAYLVARRSMRAGEEITWHYQVALR